MKNLKQFSKLTPKVIGHIGVDAGIIWIGDPCYILHKEKEEIEPILGKDWGEFCDILGDTIYKSFNYKKGHEGLGVCTSTKDGDGFYDVIGFFDGDSSTPSCVLVDFDDIFFDQTW